MQEIKKSGSAATWAVATVLALAFGAWEAYGCYKSDAGMATHRAWIAQVVLGFVLVIGTLILSVPAFFFVRDRKKVVGIMLCFIGIGLTPILVRLLWGPLCQLILHRVY